jgi:TPR repeat protein
MHTSTHTASRLVSLSMHADDHREAAARGDARAQYALGLCYLRGEDGVRTDLVEAERLIRLSAKQEHDCALLTLAEMYRISDCVPRQKYLEAARWCRRAIMSCRAFHQDHLDHFFGKHPGLQEALGSR